LDEASLFEEWYILLHWFVVSILEDDGNNIVGVGADPVIYCSKIGCDWACVKNIT